MKPITVLLVLTVTVFVLCVRGNTASTVSDISDDELYQIIDLATTGQKFEQRPEIYYASPAPHLPTSVITAAPGGGGNFVSYKPRRPSAYPSRASFASGGYSHNYLRFAKPPPSFAPKTAPAESSRGKPSGLEIIGSVELPSKYAQFVKGPGGELVQVASKTNSQENSLVAQESRVSSSSNLQSLSGIRSYSSKYSPPISSGFLPQVQAPQFVQSPRQPLYSVRPQLFSGPLTSASSLSTNNHPGSTPLVSPLSQAFPQPTTQQLVHPAYMTNALPNAHQSAHLKAVQDALAKAAGLATQGKSPAVKDSGKTVQVYPTQQFLPQQQQQQPGQVQPVQYIQNAGVQSTLQQQQVQPQQLSHVHTVQPALLPQFLQQQQQPFAHQVAIPQTLQQQPQHAAVQQGQLVQQVPLQQQQHPALAQTPLLQQQEQQPALVPQRQYIQQIQQSQEIPPQFLQQHAHFQALQQQQILRQQQQQQQILHQQHQQRQILQQQQQQNIVVEQQVLQEQQQQQPAAVSQQNVQFFAQQQQQQQQLILQEQQKQQQQNAQLFAQQQQQRLASQHPSQLQPLPPQVAAAQVHGVSPQPVLHHYTQLQQLASPAPTFQPAPPAGPLVPSQNPHQEVILSQISTLQKEGLLKQQQSGVFQLPVALEAHIAQQEISNGQPAAAEVQIVPNGEKSSEEFTIQQSQQLQPQQQQQQQLQAQQQQQQQLQAQQQQQQQSQAQQQQQQQLQAQQQQQQQLQAQQQQQQQLQAQQQQQQQQLQAQQQSQAQQQQQQFAPEQLNTLLQRNQYPALQPALYPLQYQQQQSLPLAPQVYTIRFQIPQNEGPITHQVAIGNQQQQQEQGVEDSAAPSTASPQEVLSNDLTDNKTDEDQAITSEMVMANPNAGIPTTLMEEETSAESAENSENPSSEGPSAIQTSQNDGSSATDVMTSSEEALLEQMQRPEIRISDDENGDRLVSLKTTRILTTPLGMQVPPTSSSSSSSAESVVTTRVVARFKRPRNKTGVRRRKVKKNSSTATSAAGRPMTTST